MKTKRIIIGTAIAAAMILSASGLRAQGDLEPPGAPGETMKTLDQLEPRTPIPGGDSSFTISSPGSYYLATNMFRTLTIEADNVVEGNDGDGIQINGSGCQMIGNVVNNNGGCGIYLHGPYDENTIQKCAVTDNAGHGIFVDADESHCDNNRIVDCNVSGNAGRGIYLLADGMTEACDGNAIADCTVNGNSERGITLAGYTLAGACKENTIRNCTLSGNGSGDIFVAGYRNVIEDNRCSGAPGQGTYGIYGWNLDNSVVIRNQSIGHDHGISVDSSSAYGPSIDSTGMITNNNPWANFEL